MTDEPRIIYDMPERLYHANCGVDVPLFSSSIAKKLVTQSELHAYTCHPALGNEHEEATEDMDEGSIFDALITGNADKIAVTEDFEDFRTKDAKAWRDAQKAAGRIPLVAAKFARYANAAESVRKRLKSAGADLSDVMQPTILFHLTASNGNKVACKARLDHLHRGTGLVSDIKKIARGAKPDDGMTHHIYRYGYDIQATMYPLAVEQVFPQHLGRSRFEWLFVEPGRPHAVSRCTPSGSLRALGAARLQLALDKWERALRLDEWPGYEGVHRISATPRMLEDMLIEEVTE